MAIDLSSVRSLALRVDSGSAYEALLGLGMARSGWAELRHTEGARIVARLKALPAPLRRAIRSVDSGVGFNWFDLIGLVSRAEPPRGIPELTRLLEAMDPLDLKLAMLGFHKLEYRRSVGEALFRAAAAGRKDSMDGFREAAAKSEGGGGGPLLALPPDVVRERTVAILSELPEDFYLADRSSAGLFAESAEEASALTATLKPSQVLERMTKGIVYTGEPGVEGVLLVPTLIFRPWTMIIDHERVKIFCYPIPLARISGELPDAEMVALFRALGDETRLRLLKRIARGKASFGQLARELGLAKSTVFHHALQLRTAGLLRLDLESSGLELAPDLPGMDRLLRGYLADPANDQGLR